MGYRAPTAVPEFKRKHDDENQVAWIHLRQVTQISRFQLFDAYIEVLSGGMIHKWKLCQIPQCEDAAWSEARMFLESIGFTLVEDRPHE